MQQKFVHGIVMSFHSTASIVGGFATFFLLLTVSGIISVDGAKISNLDIHKAFHRDVVWGSTGMDNNLKQKRRSNREWKRILSKSGIMNEPDEQAKFDESLRPKLKPLKEFLQTENAELYSGYISQSMITSMTHSVASRRLADDDAADDANDDGNYTYNNPYYDLSGYAFKYHKCQPIQRFSSNVANDKDYFSPLVTDYIVLLRLCPQKTCKSSMSHGCNSGFGEYAISLSDYLRHKTNYYKARMQNLCALCDECIFSTLNDNYNPGNNGNNRHRRTEDGGGDDAADDGGGGDDGGDDGGGGGDDGGGGGDDGGDNDDFYAYDDAAVAYDDAAAAYDDAAVAYDDGADDDTVIYNCTYDTSYVQKYYEECFDNREYCYYNYVSYDDDEEEDGDEEDYDYDADIFSCGMWNPNVNYYMAPRCDASSGEMLMGYFFDKYCSQYSGRDTNLDDFTGIDSSTYFELTNCVNCKSSYDPVVNETVMDMCSDVYAGSGRCNTYLAKVISEDNEDEAEISCNYIKNIRKGVYTTDGFIAVNGRDQQTDAVITNDQIAWMVVVGFISLALSIYSCMLHHDITNTLLHRLKTFIKKRRGRSKSANRKGRRRQEHEDDVDGGSYHLT